MPHKNQKIEAVVFDIGNVLVEWQPERFFDGVIGAERRRALFAEVDLNGMNLRIDAGAPFDPTVTAMAEEHPEWETEILIWKERWIEMITPAIDETVTMMRALKARRVPVLALSNFGRETFSVACEKYSFLNEFDQTFISGFLKVLKPDPEIYRIVEDKTGWRAEQLFFTDDRPENINAATARGWHTHLFTSAAGLRARLEQENLLN